MVRVNGKEYIQEYIFDKEDNLLKVDYYKKAETIEKDAMKIPQRALLKLGVNKIFDIESIHFATQQVTLKQKDNTSNTVDFKDVDFIIGIDEYETEQLFSTLNKVEDSLRG